MSDDTMSVICGVIARGALAWITVIGTIATGAALLGMTPIDVTLCFGDCEAIYPEAE